MNLHTNENKLFDELIKQIKEKLPEYSEIQELIIRFDSSLTDGQGICLNASYKVDVKLNMHFTV